MKTQNVTASPKSKARIESVRIEHKADTAAEHDHLGEYCNERKSKYSIERENAGHREYRWFEPCHENYAGCTEYEIRKYCLQDFERCEALNAGNWHYMGVTAKAVIVSASGIIQTLRSGGLWGVESDSGADYISEVEAEELAGLRAELESFGFSSRAITHAFKSVIRPS